MLAQTKPGAPTGNRRLIAGGTDGDCRVWGVRLRVIPYVLLHLCRDLADSLVREGDQEVQHDDGRVRPLHGMN